MRIKKPEIVNSKTTPKKMLKYKVKNVASATALQTTGAVIGYTTIVAAKHLGPKIAAILADESFRAAIDKGVEITLVTIGILDKK
jgi:hypothetical protein